jgi:two-component system phosphate regulon response regulator OmpR
MKTTASKYFCLPLTRAAMPASARAHTPARYPTGASRQAASGYASPLREDDGQAYQRRDERQRADRPQVLHVDMDTGAATVLSSLLVPEACVTHVTTVAEARRLLQSDVYSLVVLDPALPDGDARSLLPLLSGTPLLVYSANQPDWRGATPAFLPKPWTSARQLWTAIAALLGIPSGISAGD